jgi:hypothetical protein
LRVMPAVTRRAAARLLSENKLFAVVLIPAVLLRVDAELGYRWQSWFNDSFSYVSSAVTMTLDPTRPSGYAIYLRVLEPLHSYALVTISQHLMGLAVGVMIYALARHRFGAPAWVAVLFSLPVLFDGYEIQLEHLILSDTLFLFLVMAAVTLVLWSPRPPWWACLVAGLLLGLSAVVRATGEPLVAVFAVYLLIRFVPSWRYLLAGVAGCVIAFAVPVAAYAGWYDSQHGEFATDEAVGVFLYSRVMTFAECSQMRLPVDLLPLCTSVPPDQRPVAQAYIWTEASPLDRFSESKFTPQVNKLGEQFAIKAIEAQPLAYANTVFDDTVRSFSWSRTVFPNAATYDEYLFGYKSLDIPPGPYQGYPSVEAYYGQGNPSTQVVNPFAGAIRVYERYIYLPGTVYGLILLIGLGGIVLAWLPARRGGRPPQAPPVKSWGRGGEALLPWLCSVALIVVPAATAEFDWRYVLTAVPFGCLAAALAFGRDTPGLRWLARRGLAGQDLDKAVTAGGPVPGGAPGRASGVARGGLGGGTVDAGHDQRDFAPDAS